MDEDTLSKSTTIDIPGNSSLPLSLGVDHLDKTHKIIYLFKVLSF